jgi:hypothetical protein
MRFVMTVLATTVAMVVTLAVAVTLCSCSGEERPASELRTTERARAERREPPRIPPLNFDEVLERPRLSPEELARYEAEATAREQARRAKRARERRLRRFLWEAPADARGRVWNVPAEESGQATLTALVRICIAEADGRPQDCVGIFQVLKNIRRRTCDRARIRRITECEEDGGETLLSVMRRAQRHILGDMKLRNKRAGWIRQLETDCEPPPTWTHGLNQWDAQYTKRCQQTVALARTLLDGELPPQVPGQRLHWLKGRPITWGGRCETGKASCDDRIACSRGLARIPDTKTANAFWCRPGTAGCAPTIDPICARFEQRPDPEALQEDPVDREQVSQTSDAPRGGAHGAS